MKKDYLQTMVYTQARSLDIVLKNIRFSKDGTKLIISIKNLFTSVDNMQKALRIMQLINNILEQFGSPLYHMQVFTTEKAGAEFANQIYFSLDYSAYELINKKISLFTAGKSTGE
ncbi:hypothetical protein LFYK43_06500 [Ligilactobacillus salitolerans]|uniref:Uncharacterized protein n=1 Tax=Ligilactobacillus salitolerans TaxID=1808352 RepID=A0A401IRN8_9LACO|nr:hypothetical protein [Ligilactobacillus salitolerans]GBG94191.1 hypothetical protein LFYK43_06500 [Ligilactobacillus salitolerans]